MSDEPKIVAVYVDEKENIFLGSNGITKIDQIEKSGEMAFIPYIRTWKGEQLFQEFCQHRLIGIEWEIKP